MCEISITTSKMYAIKGKTRITHMHPRWILSKQSLKVKISEAYEKAYRHSPSKLRLSVIFIRLVRRPRPSPQVDEPPSLNTSMVLFSIKTTNSSRSLNYDIGTSHQHMFVTLRFCSINAFGGVSKFSTPSGNLYKTSHQSNHTPT